MTKNTTLKVKGIDIIISSNNDLDFISLTDIAKQKNPDFPADVVKNWMRNRSTIEFLGLWEQINENSDFKLVEFDQFKNEAGGNSFVLSPKKWLQKLNEIAIIQMKSLLQSSSSSKKLN